MKDNFQMLAIVRYVQNQDSDPERTYHKKLA